MKPRGSAFCTLPRSKNGLAFAYYITARRQLGDSGSNGFEELLREKVRDAFAAGVDYVQLREKDLPGGPLSHLASNLLALPERTRSRRPVRLLINERLDVAVACGADGIHLPTDSLPLQAVKSGAGSEWIVGISCHSEEEVKQAGRNGANYILLGPIFSTPSKPGSNPLGVRFLREVCRRSRAPVFALGGITPDNAESCIRAGAVGVAGIRLFQEATDPGALCRYLHAL